MTAINLFEIDIIVFLHLSVFEITTFDRNRTLHCRIRILNRALYCRIRILNRTLNCIIVEFEYLIELEDGYHYYEHEDKTTIRDELVEDIELVDQASATQYSGRKKEMRNEEKGTKKGSRKVIRKNEN